MRAQPGVPPRYWKRERLCYARYLMRAVSGGMGLAMLSPHSGMTAAAHMLACWLALVCLLPGDAASAASASPGGPSAPAHKPWKRIVETLAKGRSVTSTREGDRITFVIVSKRRDKSLLAGISIAPKGAFLDEGAYETAYAAAAEEERSRKFPAGGARSMLQAVFFGPGGSSSTIVSTTFDERYDIRVTVADGGTAEPERPEDDALFDVFALNERLHQHYAAKARSR